MQSTESNNRRASISSAAANGEVSGVVTRGFYDGPEKSFALRTNPTRRSSTEKYKDQTIKAMDEKKRRGIPITTDRQATADCPRRTKKMK